MAESLRAELLPFPHGFFTRRGGVSTGAFASLNCSLSSADDRAAVPRHRCHQVASFNIEKSNRVVIEACRKHQLTLLFDRGSSLEERIFAEQFLA